MIVNPEPSFTLGEIAEATGGIYDGENMQKIRRIVTDSREAEAGDLFFALPGERTDGEMYVGEVLAKGAFAVSTRQRTGVLLVRNVKEALLCLAGEYRRRLPALKCVIGVTGSAGKTTTKEFLAALLSQKYRVHATEKNYNNELGVPLTVLGAKKDTEVLIVEMGMNHEGEIAPLSEAVHPDMAIITNIGTAHIGNLGSREMIAEAKSEILSGMTGGPVLVPSEEPLLANLPNRKTVSLENPMADFFLMPMEIRAVGSVADFYHGERIVPGLALRAPGTHLLSALAFALSAAVLLGLSDHEIVSGISSIGEDKTRQSIYKIGRITIFDDAYNASFESVCAAIRTLGLFRGMKKSALIGDMLELGCMTEEYHKKVGRILVEEGFSSLYLYGVYAPFTAAGARETDGIPCDIFENTDPLSPEVTARQILAHSGEKEILLVKGSHALHLERVTQVMKEITEGKTHA
ncbi:MAG TPA: hypothetical protein DDY70_05280 [Clostridiales bacterium]|nr:hypothetical protein [Clostridiales bacterium]